MLAYPVRWIGRLRNCNVSCLQISFLEIYGCFAPKPTQSYVLWLFHKFL
uniref:Uncharacterized protein n=1 Tax=Rhizophora mucronata TaxID=61149 RepID=A0A2P2NXD1_RHIMU